MNSYILFQFSQKTGKISKTVTAEWGKSLLELWAANNTPASKETVIINAQTGMVEATITGKKNDFPDISKDAIHCTEIGIPFEVVQSYFKEAN